MGPGQFPARRRTAVRSVLSDTPDPARRRATQVATAAWVIVTGHDGRLAAPGAPDQEKGKNP